MNKLLITTALAASLLASAASAATFLTWSSIAPDGSFSANFGDTGIETLAFNDAFDFALPTGVSSFTLTSTFTVNPKNDINFTTAAFNGQTFTIGSTGQNEYRFLNNVKVTGGAPQHLVISGTSGGNGSYGGVISFTPFVGVPEPTSWALMIAGFGGVGGVLRVRKDRKAAATA